MNNTTFAEQIEASNYRQMAMHGNRTDQSIARMVKNRINHETDYDRTDAEDIYHPRVY